MMKMAVAIGGGSEIKAQIGF
jgi:hypothetical protein